MTSPINPFKTPGYRFEVFDDLNPGLGWRDMVVKCYASKGAHCFCELLLTTGQQAKWFVEDINDYVLYDFCWYSDLLNGERAPYAWEKRFHFRPYLSSAPTTEFGDDT